MKIGKLLFHVVVLGSICLAGEVRDYITEENNHWGHGGNVSSPVEYYGAYPREGVTITIEPGTIIRIMERGVSLDPLTIHAEGSVDRFIVFEPVDTNPELGNWLTVRIDSIFSNESVFKFCRFRYVNFVINNVHQDRRVDFSNCIFDKNYTKAILATNSHLRVVNCTFYSSVPGGDGITLQNCSTPVVIKNCIFLSLPVGINCYSSSTEGITYNLVGGHVASFYGCSSIPESNRKYNGVVWMYDDFRLKPNSIAVDAGDPNDSYSNEPDCDAGNQAINLGAYGNTHRATCKSDSNSIVRKTCSPIRSNGSIKAEFFTYTGRRLKITNTNNAQHSGKSGLSSGIYIVGSYDGSGPVEKRVITGRERSIRYE